MSVRLFPYCFFLLLFGSGLGRAAPEWLAARAVLEAHCFACHGPDKQKADLRLDTLNPNMLEDAIAAETWHDVLGALQLGEMPPSKAEQPSDEQRRLLVAWLTAELDRVVAARQATDGRPVLRRLNRREYHNSMRDLLGLEMDFAAELPPEGASPDGFLNNGGSLGMTGMQLDTYLRVARKALGLALVRGEQPQMFEHELSAGKTSGGVAVKNMDLGPHLTRTRVFIDRIVDDYPDAGPFLIRVKARAELVDGIDAPEMELSIGLRADTRMPSRVAGVVEVADPELATFEFRGRIEDFPMPDRVQAKYPGLMFKLANLTDDGSPLPKRETIEVLQPGQKKPRKVKRYAAETHLPGIHVESLTFLAPYYEQWPPETHARILFASPLRASDERAYVVEVLERFARRAFRRPVVTEELAPFLSLYDAVRPESADLEAAVQEMLAMVLVSPDFLYLVEPAGETKRDLSDWELASRLSYFLWKSMPDEALFAAAEAGLLHQPEVLRAQVTRLLADPKSGNFVDAFVAQWLDIDALDRVAVDPDVYPTWKEKLKPDLRLETIHFFDHILRKDLSALNFLDSDFAIVNGPLATHYGLRGPSGRAFERVALMPEDGRGGLLAQASILIGNSTGDDAHAVKRAVWIRERLLDDPPASPPPDVPDLDTADPEFARLSVRRQLEQHRGENACNDCHQSIDPWGIAMEGFGADGLARDQVQRPDPVRQGRKIRVAIDSATELPDGTAIANLAELKRYLREQQSGPFARALVVKLLTHALGRSLDLTDEASVDALSEAFVAEGYVLSRLLSDIVLSAPFQTK